VALIEVPIAIGFGEGFSLPFEGQTCDNLIPQASQTQGSSSAGALYHSPGVAPFATAGDGPHRGSIAVAGVPFWVSGKYLFTADRFGAVANLGTVSGTDRVVMAGNGITIVIIVPGKIGYFFDEDDGLRPIDDPTFLQFQRQLGGVFTVTYASSFFVYQTPFEFFNGTLRTENKGQSFLALDFGTADADPDDIVAVFEVRDELYVFSDQSVQVFQSTGAATSPFQNQRGALIPKGLASRYAVAKFNGSFVFMGGALEDPTSVWQGGSGTAFKISTAAVDNTIAKYTAEELALSFIMVYGEVGSQYMILSLPRDTLIYDAASSRRFKRPAWHTRSTNGGAWGVVSILKAFGKVLVGSGVTGEIGQMSLQNHTEFGATPIREFAGAYFQDKTNALFLSNVELVAESGVGLELGEPSGTDPAVELLISTDGARNFTSMGTRKIGMQGDTEKRMRWNRLGRTPLSAIFKFRVQEPVKIAFRKVVTDVRPGRTL
jgi:hypothetical protein